MLLAFGSVRPGIRPPAVAFSMRLKPQVKSILVRSCQILAVLCLFALSACSRNYIPNTDVEDNDLNRRVIDFCENYRHAVERRNTALLLKLAHPSYYEDGGNVDSSDDLDYAGLRDYLNKKFNQASAIRYEIFYREVSEGRKETVLVDFTYTASYKIPTPTGEVWRRRVADNRLELVREGEKFRILSGM
jgi:hypothetical protein